MDLKCPLCGYRCNEEDVVGVLLENTNGTVKVCEACCANVTQALIASRSVKIHTAEGILYVEVL